MFGRTNKIILAFLVLLPLLAQAQYYFGRNKIQYNQFDWHILKTEHFDIYYYPQMIELAEIGAAHAEKVYRLLETKFNHNINRRIPLIFYATHAHFQESNTIPYMIPEGVGGFFEFLKGRVVVPANGSISQFKHVLQHELVHVFTHSKINRILKDHRLTNHPGVPLWFTEGLAELWSEGWDSQAEMFLRDAVLNNYIFLPSKLYQISGSFLMYKEGQALLKYISETYGEEKILQLIENVWMGRRFSEVLKVTIGLDYEDLDRKWGYALKKMNYPLLKEYESVRMTTRQLTKRGINIKPAYYSEDDKEWIVFLSNRTGYSNIYLKPLADAEDKKAKAEVLVAGERTADFESFHLLSSNIDVNASGELAFVSKSGERDQLYIYDIKKRKIIEKHKFEDLVSLFSPSWSPDGSRIAFSGLAFSGKNDLYIFDREQKTLLRLTDDYYDDREPAWSPDGSVLAFSSDRGLAGKDGYHNLFLYDLETGLINYVTHGEFNDNTPAWSPDGRYLAFSSDRSGTPNIWLLSVNGGAELIVSAERNYPSADEAAPKRSYRDVSALKPEYTLKQITYFTTGAFDPEWTPKGDLLFSAFENLSFQLHILEDVDELFKDAKNVARDQLAADVSPWEFEKLGGESGPTGIKYKPKFDLDVAQSQITQDPIFGTSGLYYVANFNPVLFTPRRNR